MSCYIARYIACYIQKIGFECNSSCYIVTLPVTLNVTAETVGMSGFEGCCYIVTFISYKVVILDKLEKHKKRETPKTPDPRNHTRATVTDVTGGFGICPKAK